MEGKTETLEAHLSLALLGVEPGAGLDLVLEGAVPAREEAASD